MPDVSQMDDATVLMLAKKLLLGELQLRTDAQSRQPSTKGTLQHEQDRFHPHVNNQRHLFQPKAWTCRQEMGTPC